MAVGGLVRRFVIAMVVVASVATSYGADVVAPEVFFGEFEGTFTATGRPALPAYGEVVSEGPGLYRTTIAYTSEGPNPQTYQIELHGHVEGNRVEFAGFSNSLDLIGTVQDGHLHVQRRSPNYGGVFDLDRVVRHSPTEGLEAPDGAIVLLPYKEGQAPDLSAWTNDQWKALPDGSMQVEPGSGSNTTKQALGSIKLHMEFAPTHRPLRQAQDRGNSGCYFQSRYEVQVLDSFGVLSGSGDCGAIYETAAPRVNACYPPEQWQTYDIEFHAPTVNADGTLKTPARITVIQNGVPVQEDQVVDHVTRGGIEGPFVEKDVLLLQDHGHPVRYRNMWAVPIND